MTSSSGDLFTVPLSGGRSLTLCLEPGPRPESLYRLALTGTSGLQAGGFTGTGGEIIELFLAFQHLGEIIDRRGFPGEIERASAAG